MRFFGNPCHKSDPPYKSENQHIINAAEISRNITFEDHNYLQTSSFQSFIHDSRKLIIEERTLGIENHAPKVRHKNGFNLISKSIACAIKVIRHKSEYLLYASRGKIHTDNHLLDGDQVIVKIRPSEG